jgi:hypothetical protein
MQGRLGVYNVALFLTLEQVGDLFVFMLHEPSAPTLQTMHTCMRNLHTCGG